MISLFGDNDAVFVGLVSSAILFIVYALVVGVLIDAAEARIRYIQAASDWGRMFGKLDDAAREAVAIKFKPIVRYVWTRDKLEEQFENTGVEIEVFRQFLQESTKKTTASRRDWVTKDRTPKAYDLIYRWLVDNDYVIPDSDSGNQSYLWKTEWSREQLMGRYWMAGRKIADMSYKETETI
jgi:hypothetical protein